jgi:hypothetical protein
MERDSARDRTFAVWQRIAEVWPEFTPAAAACTLQGSKQMALTELVEPAVNAVAGEQFVDRKVADLCGYRILR